MNETLIASDPPCPGAWQQVNWSRLAALPTPVLSWISEVGREELSGVNATRWVAKIANYLNAELGAGTHLALALRPSWRAVVWQAGAALADVELTELEDGDCACSAGQFDLVVTDRSGFAAAVVAADPAALVLAHDPTPLAWQWRGDLPVGVLDALAEVSAQADSFVSAPPPPSSSPMSVNSEEELSACLARMGARIEGEVMHVRADLVKSPAGLIAFAWARELAVYVS